MHLIMPFRGLRPAAGHAEAVIAPPYDVLSTAEARARAAGRPFSFLHISKPEIDLPDDTDPYADSVYAKAVENLSRLLQAGVLYRVGKRYTLAVSPQYDLEAGEFRAASGSLTRVFPDFDVHANAVFAAHGHLCVSSKGHRGGSAEWSGADQAGHGDDGVDLEEGRLCHRGDRQMAPRPRRSEAGLEWRVEARAAGDRF